MEKSVRYPRCAVCVVPVLPQGGGFLQAASPACQEYLSYAWHLEGQLSRPLRWVKWIALAVLLAGLLRACTRAFSVHG